jgi:hypothetical protein
MDGALEFPDPLFHFIRAPEHAGATDHCAAVDCNAGLIARFFNRYFVYLTAAGAGHQDFFEFLFRHETTINSWDGMIKNVPVKAGSNSTLNEPADRDVYGDETFIAQNDRICMCYSSQNVKMVHFFAKYVRNYHVLGYILFICT